MRTIKNIREAQLFRHKAGAPVILVPTMGALHAGHAALIDAARARAVQNGTVIVSIFVNPTQFAPTEDFAEYPRTPEADFALCSAHGADAVFVPNTDDMYPPGDSAFVDEGTLASGLCGSSRPGHFRGVCTVVAKLFNILRPDAAIFGEKDYQQLAVIRRMARDLFFGIEIVGHPTVREPDGLAMSSRNRYLGPEERKRAAKISEALCAAATKNSPGEIAAAASDLIEKGAGAAPEYVAVVDAETLQPVTSLDQPAVLAVAVRIGKTRLIDNLRLEPAYAKV